MANTDKEVLKQKEKAGINAYYKLGYYGKGNVMQMESNSSDHADGVVEDILDIAPNMKIYRTGSTIISDSCAIKQATCAYQGITYEIEDFIKKFNIKILTESVGGKQHDSVMEPYYEYLKKTYNIILVAPTGNLGSKDVTTAFPVISAIQVGAISISDRGIIKLTSYSGYDDIGDVDFVYFTGDQNGTSYSTPRIVGVIGLLLDRFGLDKTQDEIFEMLKLLSVDMEVKGLDARTGYGYPVLHEDDHRRLGKLAEQIVRGTLREIDVELLPSKNKKQVRSILYGNENYIRLRDFEDILGVVDVEYDEATKIPTIKD